ncbi:MAG: hypothetical protein HY515_01585 [Candidatus Aenigmarchaeota archaeon]|nr:hypothetical protein [Candidatus Aenigmarchaeota archaeon]
MKKSWGLTEKILSREKSIESRWLMIKCAPWDKVGSGDTIYFKNSGEPVRIKSKVRKIVQFSALTPPKVMRILGKYGKADGIEEHDLKKFHGLFKNKKYCILVFLSEPSKIEPFWIDKRGFGSMSSWISINSVDKIRKGKQ